MAKKNKRSAAQAPAPPTTAELEAAKKPVPHPSSRGGRETVDALVVAFVLAFLIRTFQAEAFVIPTGSMAPTLMGRHKDVFCDQCGHRFRVNSSDDTADAVPALRSMVQRGQISPRQMKQQLIGLKCAGGACPNCRYVMPLDADGLERFAPAWADPVDPRADYSGDRLVVSKYAYSFADPKRWDVIVFKYPGNSQTNYIKRLVGLPGEEMRLFQGDVYLRPLGAEDTEFEIERKPPEQVLAMRQAVHDTDHDPANLHKADWPLRWSSNEGWQADTASEGSILRQTHLGTSPDDTTRWLRYRHTPPTEPVWGRVLSKPDEEPVDFEPTPSLVTDFTPYNTQIKAGQVARLGGFTLTPTRPADFGRLGVHWVGDLMLEADVRIDSPEARLSLDVVEAGVHYGVTIDSASGEATLWRQDFESTEQETLATTPTRVRGAGSHRIMLANVDNQLLLWIDGALIDCEARYTSEASDAVGPAQLPQTSDSDPGDLAPAGVGVANGVIAIDRLRVWRDGYYLAARWDDLDREFTTDYAAESFPAGDMLSWGPWLIDLASNPDDWGAFSERRHADFTIDEGQLFVLGDNSGWSLDARLWYGGNGRDKGKPGGAYLERTQLVGKAICVYWPHAWYSVPFTNRMIPAWPNTGDMRLVR